MGQWDRGFGRLDRADLTRLRDAVRAAARPGQAIRRREVLAVHAAAPKDAGLTVDLEASATLGMPMVVVRLPAPRRSSPRLGTLTRREWEVAGLVSAGLANKEIAVRLGLRISTVKEHVHRILVKADLPSRSAIARLYVGADAIDEGAEPRDRARATVDGGGGEVGGAHEAEP